MHCFLQDKVQKGLCAFSSSPGGNVSNTHFCRKTGYVANTQIRIHKIHLLSRRDHNTAPTKVPHHCPRLPPTLPIICYLVPARDAKIAFFYGQSPPHRALKTGVQRTISYFTLNIPSFFVPGMKLK